MLILCRRKSSAPLQPPPEKVLQQYLEEQLIALLIKGPVAKRLAVGDPDAEKSGRGEGLGTGCGAPDAYTVHGLRCYGPRRIRHLLPAVGPPPSRRHGPLAPIPSKPAELLPFLSNKSTPIDSSSARYILHYYTYHFLFVCGNYCPTMIQLDSKDSSRREHHNYAIIFLFTYI
ncbi:uncharacterized protein LOC120643451 isoform X1 [Panicum virgatum]|uniref:uncharacterized protein LOC120643451 isoform X1 n=1 Tax=Panicum virgatum TaxID=38727 RepID=UPI0019D6094E|nr:uncharacterized protein LOC120643451 isoform X1 [Panicum virgatum]